jgi:hypothetical protein
VPRGVRAKRRLSVEQSAFLCAAARRALAAREAGERRYLLRFEQEVAEAWRAGPPGAPSGPRPARSAVDTLRLGLDFVRSRIRAAAESLP